jgi:hypothetical protein
MNTRRSRLTIAIGILSSLWLIGQSAQAASSQAQQTVRSAVDLVTIQASVRGRRGLKCD